MFVLCKWFQCYLHFNAGSEDSTLSSSGCQGLPSSGSALNLPCSLALCCFLNSYISGFTQWGKQINTYYTSVSKFCFLCYTESNTPLANLKHPCMFYSLWSTVERNIERVLIIMQYFYRPTLLNSLHKIN